MYNIKDLNETSLLSTYTEEFLSQCFDTLGRAIKFYQLSQIGRHGEGEEIIPLSVSTNHKTLEREMEQRKKHDKDEVLEIASIAAEQFFCALKPLGYNEFTEIWRIFVDLAEVWNAKNSEITSTLTQAKALLSTLKKKGEK